MGSWKRIPSLSSLFTNDVKVNSSHTDFRSFRYVSWSKKINLDRFVAFTSLILRQLSFGFLFLGVESTNESSNYLIDTLSWRRSTFVVHFKSTMGAYGVISCLFHVHGSSGSILYVPFPASSLKNPIKKASAIIKSYSSTWASTTSTCGIYVSITAISLRQTKFEMKESQIALYNARPMRSAVELLC